MNNRDLPEGFKMTELGPLPEEWEVVRLASIFKPIPKEEREVIIQDENWYSLVTVRLYAKGLVLRSEQQGYKIGTKRLFRLSEGDFVFSRIDARNGAWGFVPSHLAGCLVSGDFPILQLNSDIADQDFIHFALSRPAVWSSLRNVAIGTTGRKRVRTESLQELPLPLPPLPEQRAIAQVLRTVQRAKEATERVIAAARELKKSLMRHLFTYGPVPVGQVDGVRLKETEIGPVPEHWEVVRLGDIGQVITGRTPPTAHAEYWNGAIPFITPVDLKGGPIHRADRSITEQGLTKAKPLPKGAVLVSCIGYIGKIGVVDTELAVTNQQINAVICQKADNWFVAYALMQEVGLLEARARMTTVPILHKANFERVPIPLPPLPEQRAIADILRTVDRKIQAEEQRKAALDALFKTLLHHLMTGKVRVRGAITEPEE